MFQNEFIRPLYADLREQILSELPCGLCVARRDERLTLVFANESFYHMLGYKNAAEAQQDGMLGALDRAEEQPRKLACARLNCMLEADEQTTSLELKLHRSNGEILWCMMIIRRAENDEDMWICALMDISAQKHVEEELRVREEEYRIAVHQSDKLVFRYDIKERTAYLPPESAELFHINIIYDLPTFLEEKGVFSPESLEAFRELHAFIVSGTHPTGSVVMQLNLCCDVEEYEWYRVVYSLIFREDGAPAQAVISLQNVSEQHAREVAYRRWEKTYQSMPQDSTAYLEFDLTQNRLESQKGALIEPIPEVFRATMEDAMRHFLGYYVHPEDRERIRAFTAREHLLTEYFRSARMEKQEYRHQKEDGRYVWVRLSVQMLPDPYSTNVRASILIRDIDAQKREELTLMDQLRTDVLTGVLNRGAFMNAANAVFAQPRSGTLHALVMVDVDHFKCINDRFGHGYGDRVLSRICDILRNALRADDLVGRIGGDEFVLLLKNVVSREALQAKINSLCLQLNQRINENLSVSCSFGAASCPQDGTGFDELYWKADTALYAAKEAGRNCTRVYEPDMGKPMPLFESVEG